jgi:hypothetical protein
MLYFRNYAGPLRPAGGGGIWLAFAFYRSCLPPIANSPQMPPQLSRPCMPNVAGCGPDSSVNRWTSPGRARIAARLLPRFAPPFCSPAGLPGPGKRWTSGQAHARTNFLPYSLLLRS